MKELQKYECCVMSDKIMQKTSNYFWLEFSLLLQRSYRNSFRNPMHMKSRIMIIALTMLMFFLFYDLGYSYDDTISKVGLMFYFSNNHFTMNFFDIFLNIIAEKDILRKEYKNKTYGIPAIYFFRAVFKLPIMFILGLLF